MLDDTFTQAIVEYNQLVKCMAPVCKESRYKALVSYSNNPMTFKIRHCQETQGVEGTAKHPNLPQASLNTWIHVWSCMAWPST